LYKGRLHKFDGGNLRNAIPREAFAVITMKERFASEFEQSFEKLVKEIKEEFRKVDPGLIITLKDEPLPGYIIRPGVQRRLLQSIYACPHGVISYSQDIPGLVETSTNLASVKFIEDNQIVVTTSQRSSVESAKRDISEQIANLFRLAKARVVQTGGYPGWTPDTDSEILRITEAAYQKLFGQEPVVRAIHAGLECGLFLQKYPNLDMISFGPTIKGVHSPDEKINIPTTQKFWDLLLEVLGKIPEK
jgi:dipeptidase D